MSQKNDIPSFLRTWQYLRSMTTSFIEHVPLSHWDFHPSSSHGPLCKQFRHMVWVSDLYRCALRDGKIDMVTKKQEYGGSTERSEILAAIKDRDVRLEALLSEEKFLDVEYRIDFFGTQMTVNEFTQTMVQHESLHHGMWSVYASLAGFPPPDGWKNDWGL
ncbi:MAG: DinB family protein [Oligoflexales bacterium]